jgi:N-carbamoyl-L-amino-acid hydrolase
MALAVDPKRVVSELRELRRLTADQDGAQRVAWTATWRQAREWFETLLEGLPVERSTDSAGNRWIVLPGEAKQAVVVGSHLDSVPGGGWLDGALGVLAGLEVMRGACARGTPALTLKLVDWADEEGARFGYGMVGSSAVSGSLDLERIRGLRDRDGLALPDVLAENGVDIDRMPEAAGQLDGARAYVELHIEQGPVLERSGLALSAVIGTSGVERHVVRFTGQAAHAGSTPMEDRRDPLMAAARFALAVREQAVAVGGKATVGRCVTRPGIATAVAGEAEITLDQRDIDGAKVARMLEQARASSEQIAAEERVECEWSGLWRIDPIAFDPELVTLVENVVEQVTGAPHRMPSGPLHDAAEVSRAGIPTVMMFVQSLRGISHAKEEDTRAEELELAVAALAEVVDRLLEGDGAQ